jgi:SAM-dependent methyltransferase
MAARDDRAHFDRVAERYSAATETWAALYEQAERAIDPLVRGRTVLDIGNGGHFVYDTRLPSHITALDVSPMMLEKIDDPRVEKQVGDARDLGSVADESVDVIIFFLVLHHIPGDSVRASGAALTTILDAAYCKLRPGGHLVVGEAVFAKPLFLAECLAFPLTRRVLARLRAPMLFFFSQTFLTDRIARHFPSPCAPEVTKLHLRGWIDPVGATMPGVIKIPAWLHPLQHRLIIQQKV